MLMVTSGWRVFPVLGLILKITSYRYPGKSKSRKFSPIRIKTKIRLFSCKNTIISCNENNYIVHIIALKFKLKAEFRAYNVIGSKNCILAIIFYPDTCFWVEVHPHSDICKLYVNCNLLFKLCFFVDVIERLVFITIKCLRQNQVFKQREVTSSDSLDTCS